MAKYNLKSSTKGRKRNNTNHFLLKAQIAECMKDGLVLEDAVKLIGISKSTLGILRSDPEFEEFIEQCSVNCENEHLRNISSAGQSQWQASAWILERKFPDKYGKKDAARHEYELKLIALQKILIDVVNSVDPSLRIQVMQKLRSVNIEDTVNNINENEMKLINGK